VVGLTQVLSGPFCTMLLADLGAGSIKVEPPGGDVARLWGPHPTGPDGAASTGDDGSYGGYFASVNRNKRSISLDLKTPDGRQTVLDLLAGADVLVENFRVGVMERFGLAARDMIVQVDHPVGRPIGIAGIPIKLTRTPATRLVRAPLVGEHTAEVLEELARRRADDVPGRGTPALAGPGGDRP
jgi:crotonobetainyl-CoA:carnitine CoA-transferase CaiB-like acyl-CoA transferase